MQGTGRRVALIAAAATFMAAGQASAATTRYVDDDAAQCPAATFTTIQSAVTASGPGDVIQVCAGVYKELVKVPAGKNGLKLQSQETLGAKIQVPATVTTDATTIDIQSKNVLVDDFYISGPAPVSGGCVASDFEEGVHVQQGGSAVIQNNRITAVRAGNPLLFGCQFGRAIRVDTGSAAAINNNTIDNYQKNGIDIRDAGSSASVQNNTVTGEGPQSLTAQNGIVVLSGAKGIVWSNNISENTYTTPGTDATGILLQGAGAGTSVKGNFLRSNGVGLYLSGQTGAVVENASARYNLADGIRLEGSSGNTIKNSVALSNGGLDCSDDSTGGTGTAGTNNTWTNDRGVTMSPAGICHP
jgi:parallel beta-helix repeat protein